ncbi:MAG TPA: aspartate aminotransferase family protein, partial [Nitrososphaerales archaeon]|nr:aspartate aminotransferase family protein [Nitrososphaerales archaeon]
GLVCGRKDIVSLANPVQKEKFVSIGGGTFSENPLTMVAGLATVRHLRKNAKTIYPALEEKGERARSGIDKEFRENGIEAHTTGMGSLFLTHFGREPTSPEDASKEDKPAQKRYGLGMLTRGVFILPGHPGGISTAHTWKDIDGLIELSGKQSEALKGAK